MLLLTSWFAPPAARNESFIAAVVASFLSSQQHCGVLLNVRRQQAAEFKNRCLLLSHQISWRLTMVLTWILIYGIAFAVVTALAAKSRGRDPLTWALIGFFFGVFGLIAVLVMEEQELEDDVDWPNRSQVTSREHEETKKCPDCAEEIKAEAKVCRFCGKRFDEAEVIETTGSTTLSQPLLSGKEHKVRSLRCPHCYTMNYDTDVTCTVCGKDLPVEE
jgi:hypothetical protein